MNTLRSAVGGMLGYCPLEFLKRLAPRDPIGVLYHTIAEQPLPHIQYLYQHKTPQQFIRDIEYLAKHYTLCGLDDLEAPRRSKARCCITFDDGMRECFDSVRDILLKMGIPAAFFITASLVDNKAMFYRHKVSLCIGAIHAFNADARRSMIADFGRTRFGKVVEPEEVIAWLYALQYSEQDAINDACHFFEVNIDGFLRRHAPCLSRDQINKLAADGFDIGAHTVHHPNFASIEPVVAEQEIADSCEYIGEMIGAQKVAFAFPYSSEGLAYDWIKSLFVKVPRLRMLFDSTGLSVRQHLFNRIWMEWSRNDLKREHVAPILRRLYAMAFTTSAQIHHG